ncbi:Predicted oxidoreductase [[Clostridium] polysaccharolyticum]|uniref:Predicted oxidoreductase n=1 Tax=[Clostridium] polysaccharolyticum TaxID=29364 RepID=A0A1I0CKZ4_9FIRM|nr:aldo/keto reductase [[Clostridium] polysaccharolyticum]SET20306.1 Predicted oxidoreductase [[Clostridium] polysaccharolyticum]
MQYAKLGKSDLNVSRICLGCMGFGDSKNGQHSWTVDEEQTRIIIKRALEVGINFFDTAIAYQNGTSEKYVGKALRDFAKREDYVIATKFLPRSQEELDNNISGQDHVMNSLNLSLEHLGMDYVDLYIYHMWDYHTPMEEIMEGLHMAVTSGKTRYIGISNCYAWQIAKANAYAREHGLTEFISIQGHYNLIAREEEREMAPFCASENIAMTPFAPDAEIAEGKMLMQAGKRDTEDWIKSLYGGKM